LDTYTLSAYTELLRSLHVLFDGHGFSYDHGNLLGRFRLCVFKQLADRDGRCRIAGSVEDNTFGGDRHARCRRERRHNDYGGFRIELEHGYANRDSDGRGRWNDANFVTGAGERRCHLHVLFDDHGRSEERRGIEWRLRVCGYE